MEGIAEDRIMTPKDIHVPISRTHEHVRLPGEEE